MPTVIAAISQLVPRGLSAVAMGFALENPLLIVA